MPIKTTSRGDKRPFCVTLRSTTCYKIIVHATDESDAIEHAEYLWLNSEAPPFEPSSFDTHCWCAVPE